MLIPTPIANASSSAPQNQIARDGPLSTMNAFSNLCGSPVPARRPRRRPSLRAVQQRSRGPAGIPVDRSPRRNYRPSRGRSCVPNGCFSAGCPCATRPICALLAPPAGVEAATCGLGSWFESPEGAPGGARGHSGWQRLARRFLPGPRRSHRRSYASGLGIARKRDVGSSLGNHLRSGSGLKVGSGDVEAITKPSSLAASCRGLLPRNVGRIRGEMDRQGALSRGNYCPCNSTPVNSLTCRNRG